MIKMTAEEVLAALPNMTKAEKQSLKQSLKKEENEVAWKTYAKHRVEEIEKDSSGRPSGTTSSGSQMPIRPSRLSQAQTLPARAEEVPKVVKARQLELFRRNLYEDQVQGGRLVPSTCAPIPNATQARCPYPFESIRWSANGEGHYGRCRLYDLKHVIYFSERHGAMITALEAEVHRFVTSRAGEAIADSGYRCAVAGKSWHQAMQKELRRLGMSWHEEEESESFRFGSGEPEESKKAFIYPVGIHGRHDLVRMSSASGGVFYCPGLLGPSELSRWSAMLRFQERTMELKGVCKPIQFTGTRHPAIDLLDYDHDKIGEAFWKDEVMQKTLRTLRDAPHAWAFVSQEAAEDEEKQEESAEGEESEEVVEGSGGEESEGEVEGRW